MEAGATNIVPARDYIAFFCWVGDKYWALQGPSGLRPVSRQYQEVRLDENGGYRVDTFTHTDYLNAIRKLAAVPKVTISELLKNQSEYFGRRVEVAGYYVSSFEYSGLYETKEDLHRFREDHKPLGAIYNGLWIMPFAKQGYEDQIRPVKEGMVRIIGTFHYNRDQDLGVGHLNGWPAELVALEAFEPLP